MTKAGQTRDHPLRSTEAVTGYNIQASDGERGQVQDFIVDDETWSIRYLVIATKNWWPGKKVLRSPQWIGHMSWPESKVIINLSRATIKQSPEFTEEAWLNRDYEIALYGHDHRKGDWSEDLAVAE